MTHHKLIHAASERVLSDSKTILEECIQDKGKGPRAAVGAGAGLGQEAEVPPCGRPCSGLGLSEKSGLAEMVSFSCVK